MVSKCIKRSEEFEEKILIDVPNLMKKKMRKL